MKSDIAKLLQLNKCTVLSKITEAVKDGNSEFVSLPALNLNNLFTENSSLEFSANFVKIDGNQNEPVHYHISHVVGVILEGDAYLKTDQGQFPVSKGDVVVVPKNVNHEFICEDGKQMIYMAYEIADRQLDFKKHF
jgi:mannose-6-phosphate isomerase-like protein (cupin superfamily)